MELGAQRYDAHSRKVSSTTAFHTTHLHDTGESTVSFSHVRESRQAIERKGETPTQIKWQDQMLELTMDTLRLGRGSDNDIVIPEDAVSKYHCQLVREGDDLYLENLNSTNGTFANRGRVMNRFRLSVGDVMTVGSWLFRFQA